MSCGHKLLDYKSNLWYEEKMWRSYQSAGLLFDQIFKFKLKLESQALDEVFLSFFNGTVTFVLTWDGASKFLRGEYRLCVCRFPDLHCGVSLSWCTPPFVSKRWNDEDGGFLILRHWHVVKGKGCFCQALLSQYKEFYLMQTRESKFKQFAIQTLPLNGR